MRKDSYIETKRRLSRCFDIKNMSDKEIIEVLDEDTPLKSQAQSGLNGSGCGPRLYNFFQFLT